MIYKCYTMSVPHQVFDSYGVMGTTKTCHERSRVAAFIKLVYSLMRHRLYEGSKETFI